METVKNYFDFCINEECVSGANYNITIHKLYEYGYRTIAINQSINEENLSNPPKKKKKKGEPREPATDVVPAPFPIHKVKGYEDMKILNRLTITFKDQQIMHKIIKSPHYKQYDLIAIIPATQAAFQFTCSNIDADILSIDPEAKSPYRFSRNLYKHLVEKGFHFEILYSPAILDVTKRRNVIAISHLYHVFGKSKNVFISSGASNYMEIRGPYDVINLGFMFGLNEEQSKNAVSHCARTVYLNSVGRKQGKTVMLVENIEAMKIQENVEEKGNGDKAEGKDIDENEDEEEELNIDQPAMKRIKPNNIACC